ncbi:sulfite exporter TauE/SafE family protein [Patescibacteria group bacterium]|nr:sulfite exporter TauE/SafE family protein [Patescibacteria group bacterium]MBU1703494.1 sulfite exporter TauE/SafE family protein [Patescibacteria group bacterium]MBU1953351.1 sulfite exporter TauE/SafE family protein [Patescibacteria group bacterium]
MEILYISLLTILASGIGTLTGFGTSTIMVPVMLFFLPLPQTLLLVGIIHWFSDIWKIALFRKGLHWKLIFLFGIAGIIASYAGANLVFSVPNLLLSQILGAFLVIYALFLFLKPKFKIPPTNIAAIGGGALSGFFAGLFGVGGTVGSVFLSAFKMPKAVYLATAGAISFFINISRITAYIVNGTTLEKHLLWGFLLFIPTSLLGAEAAKKIVDRIPGKKFHTVIIFFLLLAGIKFLFFTNK